MEPFNASRNTFSNSVSYCLTGFLIFSSSPIRFVIATNIGIICIKFFSVLSQAVYFHKQGGH